MRKKASLLTNHDLEKNPEIAICKIQLSELLYKNSRGDRFLLKRSREYIDLISLPYMTPKNNKSAKISAKSDLARVLRNMCSLLTSVEL